MKRLIRAAVDRFAHNFQKYGENGKRLLIFFDFRFYQKRQFFVGRRFKNIFQLAKRKQFKQIPIGEYQFVADLKFSLNNAAERGEPAFGKFMFQRLINVLDYFLIAKQRGLDFSDF